MVTLIITGRRKPSSRTPRRSATSAALAFSVSKMVSTAAGRRRRRSGAGLLGVGAPSPRRRSPSADARVVDVGRDRERAVQRADRAGDEARARRVLRSSARPRPREPRGLEVELVREVLERVVGLRDARRAERVGLDDVGAGGEVLRRGSRSMTSGRVSTSRSLLPLRSMRVVANRGRGSRPRRACSAGSSCPWRRRARGCGASRACRTRAKLSCFPAETPMGSLSGQPRGEPQSPHDRAPVRVASGP
jgi:hypothetical protein